MLRSKKRNGTRGKGREGLWERRTLSAQVWKMILPAIYKLFFFFTTVLLTNFRLRLSLVINISLVSPRNKSFLRASPFQATKISIALAVYRSDGLMGYNTEYYRLKMPINFIAHFSGTTTGHCFGD